MPSGLGQVLLLHVVRSQKSMSRLPDALAVAVRTTNSQSRGCVGLLHWLAALVLQPNTMAHNHRSRGVLSFLSMANGNPYGLEFLPPANEALLDRRQHRI